MAGKGEVPKNSAKKATTSGTVRSTYEETTFGMNSGTGPNRSRNVHKGGGKR